MRAYRSDVGGANDKNRNCCAVERRCCGPWRSSCARSLSCSISSGGVLRSVLLGSPPRPSNSTRRMR